MGYYILYIMFATAQNFCVFLESEIFYIVTLMFCSSCQNLTFSQLDGSSCHNFPAAKNLTKSQLVRSSLKFAARFAAAII